jgi:hypothetical protein
MGISASSVIGIAICAFGEVSMIAQSVTMGITWIFKILIILVKRNVPINNTAITGPITGIQVATTVMTTAPIVITTQ